MTISLFMTRLGDCKPALLPRTGVIFALAVLLSFGAGVGGACADTGGGIVVIIGGGGGGGGGGQPPGPTIHDFYFTFSGALTGGGSVSGSATLVGEQQLSNDWLVIQLLNGKLNFQPSSGQFAGTYSLTLSSTGGPFPAMMPHSTHINYAGNPNFFGLFGIDFNVVQRVPSHSIFGGTVYQDMTVGDLFISGGNYNLSMNISGFSDTANGVNVNVAPGPTPGAGLFGLAFLMLAGAVARARDPMAR
jgi:hypothetical protein